MKSLKGLAATLAGALVLAMAGCSTPCGAPGRLCAPIESNTRAQPLPPSVTRPRAELPAPANAAANGAITPAPDASARIETRPVESPDAGIRAGANLGQAQPQARTRTRIGLLLPLRSESLGAPAEALRAGFMAAYERDREGFIVNLVDSGATAQETLDAFAAAIEQNDIIVGPLARPAVSALAASTLVRKPTIALNQPEARAGAAALPAQMLVIGLSIEDEARQVANWAGTEHPGATALIIAGSSAWQRRIAASFAARWKQLGYAAQTLMLADSNGYLSEASLNQLRAQLDGAQPALLFAALDAGQAGQVRGALGPELPIYGTSSVNPGAGAVGGKGGGAVTGADSGKGSDVGASAGNGASAGIADSGAAMTELNGLRLLDLPWHVHAAHPAVMTYPRWSGAGRTLDMERLYALGIDAFRVAREIALRPGADFRLDGVTGRLSVSFGNGAARFERIEPAAVIENGAFTLVPDGR